MSIDHVNPYDILAMNGISAALAISDIPFPTQMGGGADRQARGPVRDQPRRGRHPRVGARPDRRRHRRRDPDGRGRRERDRPRPRSSTRSRSRTTEIKKLCAAQRELAAKVGKDEDRARGADVSTRACSTRSRLRTAPSSTRRPQVEDKLERQDATKAVEEAVLEKYAPTTSEDADPQRRAEVQARVRQAREGHHPQADRRRQAPARRPRRRRDPRHLVPRSGSRRARTAPRSSPAARRRRSRSRRSAPAARSSASTRSASRPPSATSTTTTSRRTRSGRPASCAAPSAATSATARSPSGRCCR